MLSGRSLHQIGFPPSPRQPMSYPSCHNHRHENETYPCPIDPRPHHETGRHLKTHPEASPSSRPPLRVRQSVQHRRRRPSLNRGHELGFPRQRLGLRPVTRLPSRLVRPPVDLAQLGSILRMVQQAPPAIHPLNPTPLIFLAPGVRIRRHKLFQGRRTLRIRHAARIRQVLGRCLHHPIPIGHRHQSHPDAQGRMVLTPNAGIDNRRKKLRESTHTPISHTRQGRSIVLSTKVHAWTPVDNVDTSRSRSRECPRNALSPLQVSRISAPSTKNRPRDRQPIFRPANLFYGMVNVGKLRRGSCAYSRAPRRAPTPTPGLARSERRMGRWYSKKLLYHQFRYSLIYNLLCNPNRLFVTVSTT
jgi:hypothetical protein